MTVRTRKVVFNSFNLMVVGHEHTGKSDFLSTLLETLNVHQVLAVGQEPPMPLPSSNALVPVAATGRIECSDVFNSKVLLRLIDSPGLEVPANLEKVSLESKQILMAQAKHYADIVAGYLQAQFAHSLEEETKVRRDPKAIDENVHACLYFINPDVILSAKCLTPMDHVVLARICPLVNVIPVLAKSDRVTVGQLKEIRQCLMEDIARNQIGFYDLGDDDESGMLTNLNEKLPFCLINSERLPGENETRLGVMVGDKVVLGREYIWGVVETLNPGHCDFTLVKNIVLGSHYDDLKDVTRDVLYENWRTASLMARKKSLISVNNKEE